MTAILAYKILGVTKNVSMDDLKKKYRMLMMLTHPDVNIDHDYPYEAADINTAYEYLLENHMWQENADAEKTNNQEIKWSAPENINAFVRRDIYQRVEDSLGNVLGDIVIDSGKYVWIHDEEFPLFQKSIYECAKKVIGEYCANKRKSSDENPEVMAKLAYLLAQQFVDARSVLELLATVERENESIYHIDAMLEVNDNRVKISKEDLLIPYKLKNHRLYLSNKTGNELGYVSFRDDRLYYGIIPLFERRSAQIKIKVKDSVIKRSMGKYYYEIDMWIKLIPEPVTYMLESINMQIETLLQNHYGMC